MTDADTTTEAPAEGQASLPFEGGSSANPAPVPTRHISTVVADLEQTGRDIVALIEQSKLMQDAIREKQKLHNDLINEYQDAKAAFETGFTQAKGTIDRVFAALGSLF